MTAVAAGGGPARTTRRIPQIADFRTRAEATAGRPLDGTQALHRWSVDSAEEFWRTLLDWSGLAWDGSASTVRTSADVRDARFFPDVRLNYAENLLRPLPDAGDDAPALTAVRRDGTVRRHTRGELRRAARRAGAALLRAGVRAGDRVAALAPNHDEVAVAGLAVAGIGATLSTATPDMGPAALLGRFGQVAPRALVVDRTGMAREGLTADAVLAELVAGLPSVEMVLLLDDDPLPAPGRPAVARLADLVEELPAEVEAEWPRLPFAHPLWVMFSSGTTGPPKAMVHGAGGALLEHVKEHRLHGDLRAGDTLYFHTTTAWMMWNWQLSALAVGAHVVVSEKLVTGPETLWELVAAHGVTVFGTSPAYLQLCQDEGYRPRDAVDLAALRSVLSTGAVLHDWQFDWVADAVGDVPLQSISGGTDIVGCFVLGHPDEPVQRGRCQSLSLGLDVAALGEEGRPVLGEVGELVCRNPFPSRPLGFLDDPDGARFAQSYFTQHPGAWTHGDLVEIGADGSARMRGRSDGVLNVDGVRIGPAEISGVVRRLPEVAETMAVEQQDPARPGSARLVLLVVPRPGAVVGEELSRRIRATLRSQASAAHVPSVVLYVEGLPTTHNGKLSERAARDALDGRPAGNLTALRNPETVAAIAAAARAATAPTAPAGGGGDGERDGEDDGGLGTAVRRVFQDVLGRSVGAAEDFFDAGGTSRQSMTLLRRLRLETGAPLAMEAFLADPTVAGVARALAAPPADRPAVHLLRPGDPALPPLFLVHGAFGDTDSFRYLVERLDVRCPVYGISGTLVRPDGSRPSVVEVASTHVAEVDAVWPEGPLLVAGYSFGGLVAYEMARQFAAAGREPLFVGLLDVRPPGTALRPAEQRLKRLGAVLATAVPGLRVRTPLQAVADVLRRAPRSAEAASEADASGVYEQYRWADYAGPVTFFRVRRRIPVIEHFLSAWRRAAPDLRVVDTPGAHHDMLGERNARTLAVRLASVLRDVLAAG